MLKERKGETVSIDSLRRGWGVEKVLGYKFVLMCHKVNVCKLEYTALLVTNFCLHSIGKSKWEPID